MKVFQNLDRFHSVWIRPHSVYCLVNELRQGSFLPSSEEKKKINKIFCLARIGGKNWQTFGLSRLVGFN